MEVTAVSTWRPGALLRDIYLHNIKGGKIIQDTLGFSYRTGRCGTPTMTADPGNPLNDRPKCPICLRR